MIPSNNEYSNSGLSNMDRPSSFLSWRANSDNNMESKERIEFLPKIFSITIFVLAKPR